MDIEYGDFDKAKAIRFLAREQKLLAGRVAELESAAPSATMNAANKGANLDKLPNDLRAALEADGFATPYALRQMSDEELLAVKGVGPAGVKKIRALT